MSFLLTAGRSGKIGKNIAAHLNPPLLKSVRLNSARILIIALGSLVFLFWSGCVTPAGLSSEVAAEAEKPPAAKEGVAEDTGGSEGPVGDGLEKQPGSDADKAGRTASGTSQERDGLKKSDKEASGQRIIKTGPQQAIVLPPSRQIPAKRLMELVAVNVPDRFIFLSNEADEPLRLYKDLDGNGYEDIFFLLVEYPESVQKEDTENGTDEGRKNTPSHKTAVVRDRRISASDLGDMSRLFSEEIRPHKFYVALFLRTPGGLVSMYRIPIGSWFVFESFRGFQVHEKHTMPFVVSTSFQTHEGKESQWVCFSKYNEFSFFTLKNSISISSEIRDIDKNGFLDVIEWRKVFEEGTGYETFLTWYKWDGNKFAQHDSTNIVRNLNQFLHSVSSLLSMGKWQQAFSLMLPTEKLRELESGTISSGELFLKLFSARAEGEEGMLGDSTIGNEQLARLINTGGRVFNTVIVPRVLENPFSGKKEISSPEYQTRFSIRFILRDGRSSVRECSVRMNDNPFASQQYFVEIGNLK